jgi:putative selenate reductase
MSDRFHPIPLQMLTDWIADELAAKESVFGIPRSLFFLPNESDPFRTSVYGQELDNPLGVAAGPHSQLAQNIVVAWLTGARFIELKTVQTLDKIEVSKPCIDMQDEGYNVEWSQELRVEQSFAEYLKAWVLIHALHRHLGFPGEDPGIIFNLSVGYDLAGLRQPNMQRYLDTIEDAGNHLEIAIDVVAKRFPEAARTSIPKRISDNVTLSTMHGCPPDEIGALCAYLLNERGLHTSVKLNPTLLGAERLRPILDHNLGFSEIRIPDNVFAEDLLYEDALSLLEEASKTAMDRGLVFGVKLTNTLAVANHRNVFESTEQTMYLSGRPLHALTVQLAHQLADDVDHPLLMSFSGGADAHNVSTLIRSGMATVTFCSDLLRPGGYLRIGQYLEEIEDAIDAVGVESLEAYVLSSASAGGLTLEEAARESLRAYAEDVLVDPAYHRDTYDRSRTKTSRHLGLFDCIVAPCTDGCDVNQRVPEYMRLVAAGDLTGAAEITRDDNPLSSILGRTCHRPCESVCLRTHMDQPLAIREIKRFITDHEPPPEASFTDEGLDLRVAVIGGGPCGLSAATFLAREGVAVTIFEARMARGGMVSATIPDYRAAAEAVERDFDHLDALGVEVRYNQEIGRDLSLRSLEEQGFSSIVVAVGARRGLGLGIEGEDSVGVLDGLDFLRTVRRGESPPLGRRVGVIGGGDVAMDCSRTARRLSDGEITVYYRRTRSEMPAQKEELLDLLTEGGNLEELVAPQRILTGDGRLRAVEMVAMRLREPDASGRRRPVPVPGSEREIELDTLIVAIGQRPDLSLFGQDAVALDESGYLEVDPVTLETSIPGVFAGGDIISGGPSNIVKACGDGRAIAEAIIARHRHGSAQSFPPQPWPVLDRVEFAHRRARVESRVSIPHLPARERFGFDEVVLTLSTTEAEREAARCLDCDLLCSTCDSVCPNRAIFTYYAQPRELRLPQPTLEDGKITGWSEKEFRLDQGPQVAVLTDACNECGNCVTFCPASGRPWKDKPRLYLDRGAFEAETDNAYMLVRIDTGRGLDARFGGQTHRMTEESGVLRYASPLVEIAIDSRSMVILEVSTRNPSTGAGSFDSRHLASMVILLQSFAESMPEFPRVEVNQS